MSITFGVSPIAWINDDMPELGGDTPLESVLRDIAEVGFAAALAKPTILLVDGTVADKMPSDLAGLSYLTYDPKNFRPLHDYLGRAVRRLTDREGER